MSAEDRLRARAVLETWPRRRPLDRSEEVLLARLVEDGRWAEASNAAADPAEAAALAERVAGGREAARRLEDHLMGLVCRVARQYCAQGVDVDDLVHEGWFGLRRALELWDHRKGFRLSTYAAWWVRRAVQRAVIRQARVIRLPVPVDQSLREVLTARQALLAECGSAPVPRIAERAALPVGRVTMLLQMAVPPLRLDGPAGQTTMVAERLPAPGSDVEQRIEHEELSAGMRRALTALGEREREVVTRRFGFRSEQLETLEDIGREIGVTRERIRQIEAGALAKLRRDRDLLALWEA